MDIIEIASDPNFDPLERRVLAVALAPSELVGVAETGRARVVCAAAVGQADALLGTPSTKSKNGHRS